ncbi:hypothetical protein [Paenibacillus harenae]|uniref:hypothetical protein n=1 Tax=Paenibacillus harenae TaxID=306543 RepID=UPI00048BC1AF|nr:hypothetical protein [Paenibacillus harenae]
MMQMVGHNGQTLTINDLSWKVVADVVNYHTTFPGKTVTNLKTKPRLKVNSYGVVLGTQVFLEQKRYEGIEGLVLLLLISVQVVEEPLSMYPHLLAEISLTNLELLLIVVPAGGTIQVTSLVRAILK